MDVTRLVLGRVTSIAALVSLLVMTIFHCNTQLIIEIVKSVLNIAERTSRLIPFFKFKAEAMKLVNHRKLSTIKHSMAKTFSARRSFILNEASTIVDVREKYQFLFSMSGLADEFYNLTENNLSDKFDEGMSLLFEENGALDLLIN